jgi:processive 1,2-diacylglycerol beta-glucosyltransferase
MGGGLGLGVEENLDALLESAPADAQIIVICGRNAAARERLEQRNLPARVQVVGFVTGIERIIAASDVIVTKPGGLTTSEALALGRPLVLTRPLPGHERANAIVLQQTGAALAADSPTELRQVVAALWNEPGRLTAMSNAAHLAGQARAAERIMHSVEFDLRQVAAA